jgi:hypothetical protein
LPDGYFQTKNQNLGKFWRVAMEDIGIFYVHLVYLTAICHFLWTFGIFPGYLVNFSHFERL